MWGWIACGGLAMVTMVAYTSGDTFEHNVERSTLSKLALETTNRVLRTTQLAVRAVASVSQDAVEFLDKAEVWWHASTHMYVNKTIKPVMTMAPPPED